jgi:hypothetical protein
MRLISRDEARKNGWRRYFTGQPCDAGHVAERFVADTRCVECEVIRNARRTLLRRTEGDVGTWRRRVMPGSTWRRS